MLPLFLLCMGFQSRVALSWYFLLIIEQVKRVLRDQIGVAKARIIAGEAAVVDASWVFGSLLDFFKMVIVNELDLLFEGLRERGLGL